MISELSEDDDENVLFSDEEAFKTKAFVCPNARDTLLDSLCSESMIDH